MAVQREHIAYFLECIIEAEGVVRGPVMSFGVQQVYMAPNYFREAAEFRGLDKLRYWKRRAVESFDALLGKRHPDLRVPKDFQADTFEQILERRGVDTVETIDLFDERATYMLDMNNPVPAELHDRFNLVIDIGSTEHVFDTKTCFENLISMTKTGGHLVLQLPCGGQFDHGFHTFSPECILQTLEVNGFEIKIVRYCEPSGAPISRPERNRDILMWVTAKRMRKLDSFVIPQQGRWKPAYEGTTEWKWK